MPLWKPGQSGNPNGRPRHYKSLGQVVRKQSGSASTLGEPLWQMISRTLVSKALGGDVQAMKLLAFIVDEPASVMNLVVHPVDEAENGTTPSAPSDK